MALQMQMQWLQQLHSFRLSMPQRMQRGSCWMQRKERMGACHCCLHWPLK